MSLVDRLEQVVVVEEVAEGVPFEAHGLGDVHQPILGEGPVGSVVVQHVVVVPEGLVEGGIGLGGRLEGGGGFARASL